jgi:NAD+ synthase (glutamine-hydrolysing)
MLIALAQLNPTVGDVPGNTALVIDAIERAHQSDAKLLVCGEMALLGYPPRDLLFRHGVVDMCEEAVREIAAAAGTLHVIVGHPRRGSGGLRGLRNSLSVCHAGEVVAVYDKRLLPGYDVFDEDRYFDPGDTPCAVEVEGRRFGLLICEDLWRAADVHARSAYHVEPLRDLAKLKCDAFISINASPFVIGKFQRHIEQLAEIAHEHRVPVISVNQVGANDDLIFDGRSVVVGADGSVTAMLPGFEPAVDTIDLSPKPSATADLRPSERRITVDTLDEIWRALVLGVRDYCRKTNHRTVILGLSGGIDSALTAAIAAAAIGPENVIGVHMPSKYTARESTEDTRLLIASIGIDGRQEIPIRELHDRILAAVEPELGDVTGSLADENIQARLRGILLMAISNSTPGGLVLSTSNKSEVATGYSTLYGDMCGALAPLGDVTKTRVYDLARWLNRHHRECGFKSPPIPERSITRTPTAELRFNQTDQDTLPPYEVLDVIVERYIEGEQSADRIIEETGLDAELVDRFTRMIDLAQYKREQAAVILKVSSRAFGRGRVMPIVMKGAGVGVVKA